MTPERIRYWLERAIARLPDGVCCGGRGLVVTCPSCGITWPDQPAR